MANIRTNPNATVYACFAGYIVQAIVNSFVPLLFLTFEAQYGIPLSQITFLITFNFGVQLVVDLLSASFVDRIGYRRAIVLAHAMAAIGFVMLVLQPGTFTGILCAVVVYAVGGGLLEVLISPIVEACPTDNKEAAMSLLHSFYCWGVVGVVAISTLVFHIVGIENWKIMALLWTILPIANGVIFLFVPIYPIVDEAEEGLSIGGLFRQKTFWVIMLMMLCAGASEQAVSQWASTYAEAGLGITKALGDLLGPMFFSICMGASRTIYGKWGAHMDLHRFMRLSAILCIVSYLMIGFAPAPIIGLLGCGLCGFAVGIFWPGTFSLAALSLRQGGTALYAFMALAGDLGCSGGPTFAGLMTDVLGGRLASGILCAIVFPILMLVMLAPGHRNTVAH